MQPKTLKRMQEKYAKVLENTKNSKDGMQFMQDTKMTT